jgi:hypothetical protein
MAMISRGLAIGALVLSVGCADGLDLDEVPVGADVQLTKEDGGLIEGRLLDRTPDHVVVDVGVARKDIERDEIADVRVVDASEPEPPPPPKATYREVTLPEGTRLQLELTSAVNTGANQVNDPVSATLSDAVVIDDVEVLPAGSPVQGKVMAVESAGKVKGRASVALLFTDISAREESYPISARFEMVAPATKTDDAKKIALPAAGGAVLGAVLGGKKGAAVGAAVGGGAGTAAVLMTPGDEVKLSSGTTLQVSLAKPLDVKVPIVRDDER